MESRTFFGGRPAMALISAGFITLPAMWPPRILKFTWAFSKSTRTLRGGHRVALLDDEGGLPVEEIREPAVDGRVLERDARQSVLDDGAAALQGAELVPQFVELGGLDADVSGDDQALDLL